MCFLLSLLLCVAYIMFMVKLGKLLVFSFLMFPIAFAALGTGILFAALNIAVARNPEEQNKMFSNSLLAFALIETFVFTGLIVCIIVYIFL